MRTQENNKHIFFEGKSELHREINDLRSLVEKSLSENKRIMEELRLDDPTFLRELYAPKMHAGENPLLLKELLLKQMDKLLEEKDELLKKK